MKLTCPVQWLSEIQAVYNTCGNCLVDLVSQRCTHVQLVLSMVCNVYTRSVVQYQEQTIGRVLANSAPYNFHDQKNDVHFMLTFRIPRKNKTIIYIHSDCFLFVIMQPYMQILGPRYLVHVNQFWYRTAI